MSARASLSHLSALVLCALATLATTRSCFACAARWPDPLAMPLAAAMACAAIVFGGALVLLASDLRSPAHATNRAERHANSALARGWEANK